MFVIRSFPDKCFSLTQSIGISLLLTVMFSLSTNAITLDADKQHPAIPKITHLEPPFWWVGMKDRSLQLMLHGENIAQYDLSTSSKKWAIQSIKRTDNHNYLFVNLTIPKTSKAGIYPLDLTLNDHVVKTINYQLKARRAGSSQRQGFHSSDAIYLITPDRFGNGDYQNDSVENLVEKVNRRKENGRHGGDIQGVIDHLDYIQQMGFTQIWLNPVLENNHPVASYHGYSTTDYYQVDGRMGSNQLYKTLSKKAKEHHLGLIKDIILNHIGTEHWWMNDRPAKDWINNIDQYKETSHRREVLHDIHGTKEDLKEFASGWFVPTMADLNQRNPLLAKYLIQNNIWWIEYADLSGLRVDTFPYSDKTFLSQFTHRIMQEYPRFNIVAEEWSTSPITVSYWQRGNKTFDHYQSDLPSLMDFPLQDALVKGLTEKETWSDGLRKLYEVLANDFVYADPYNLVIFPDNHDMSRILTQLNGDIKLTKMAVAFIATTRGIPQYFYGTEILMNNKDSGAHGVIRSDFPGGWKLDKTNAFKGSGLSKAQLSMQTFFKRLLNWRKTSKAVTKGKMIHYAPKKGVYVFFRSYGNQKVMVVLNKNEKPKLINPSLYPSMITSGDNKKMAKNVIDGSVMDLSKSFQVEPKSALIIEFSNK